MQTVSIIAVIVSTTEREGGGGNTVFPSPSQGHCME